MPRSGHPRRLVELDVTSLKWALAVLRDNHFYVKRRGAMSDEWAQKYIATETYLIGLIKKAEK